MTKKICILNHASIQNDARVLKTIDFLLSKGYHIWFFYPSVQSANENDNLKKTNLSLIAVDKRNSLISKILRHTAYPLEFYYLASEALKHKQKFDYIYVNDLPSLYAGLIIKKKNPGSRLIYDSHEIYNETVNQFFPTNVGMPKSFLFKGLIWLMRFFGTLLECRMVKKVDMFITVNESLKEYFEKEYHVSGVKVMMNCPVETKSELEPEVIVDYRSNYGWASNSRIFIYQGNLNQGRGLELLIKSFTRTPANFKLIIVGDGVLKDTLQRMAEIYNSSEKIKFLAAVPYSYLSAYTKAADVGINLLEPYNLSKALASPNKLFEYIHAGIPVVCSETKENRKVLERFDIGVLVPNTENGVLNGLLFFESYANLAEKKKSLKAAADLYKWENQTKIFDGFFA